MFQATARSSRCATVYLTQNLPNFYVQAGPESPRERVDGFFANLNTKIIHANSDPTTNHWAAEQIGKTMQYRASVQSGPEPSGPPVVTGWNFLHLIRPPSRTSTSTSPVVDYEVQPSEFSKLRTGSPANAGRIDAYVVRSGAKFTNGKQFLPVVFLQEGFS